MRVHARTDLWRCLLRMRTSALNFVFGTRLFPHFGQPLPPHLYPLFLSFTHRSVLVLEAKRKNSGRNPLLFFLSGNKNKPNGKNFFFFLFISFFQIQGTMSINIPIRPSVCLHSKVQCAKIASNKLLDCLFVRHSLQLTSLVCTLTL